MFNRGRDGSSGRSTNLLTERSVVRTRPLPLDFPCLGLGNLAVSQPSCFLRVAWQLGTERVLQLNSAISCNLASQREGSHPVRRTASTASKIFVITSIRQIKHCPPRSLHHSDRGSSLTPSSLVAVLGTGWLKWLEREFTDRKVRGSNPISVSRLPLSRLGQSGSIPALVLFSGSMAARHRKVSFFENEHYHRLTPVGWDDLAFSDKRK
ncbi:hypothetical protein CSKR_100925 [Clonorchis sinensis]|uniref:Uncharacterized protein n=1 Tax=Clonorchis sinensis TaxID=79923 RepID=A0A419Q4Q5_CLOSI|nr:hypothetical protein CSKR_100925 [Clonorchis sinensis]